MASNPLALAISLRDQAKAAGRNFKIRLGGNYGQELESFLEGKTFADANGNPTDPANAVYIVRESEGSSSVRTRFEALADLDLTVVFKDYDALPARQTARRRSCLQDKIGRLQAELSELDIPAPRQVESTDTETAAAA